MHRLVAAALVAAYLFLVAHLTLTDPSNGRWAFSLADRVAVRLSDGALTWTETEVLANIALFVPLGFLLTIATGSAWVAVTLCALLSAGIEWMQLTLLPTRVPTLDDVVHNSLGGVVGAAVAVVCLALVAGATGSRRRAAVSARG
ncbi:VanZ family protein [Nocardioides sp. C4-1]|uniref:VanZ family protein n=1 Tax=Nocardioides sp. C4-1 TaxID=3151851 RepID=UPI0032671E83